MPSPLEMPQQTPEWPHRWQWGWLWPVLLSIAFSLGVGVWLQRAQNQELEDERHTMMVDALSLQARIDDRLVAEQTALDHLATTLSGPNLEQRLPREPALLTHLGQIWISVTALDAHNNRLLVHVGSNERQGHQSTSDAERLARSVHLVANTHDGQRLIARLDPVALLRSTVPWWLARRYDIRLLDSDDQRIAALTEPLARRHGQVHRIPLEAVFTGTYLELTTDNTPLPWWRSTPMGLMLAFVALSGTASLSLRRQMRQVAATEQQWRHEASWRRAIEESLTLGLRARDMNGRVVHVNRAFADLVGYPVEALIGQLPPMPYWVPDQLEDSMRRHRRNLAGQAPREGYETQFLRADGRRIDVMMFETPWLNDRGEQLGWMGSFIDISANKAAQARERRQLDALARQARLTMLGEVASALAHQLNQPLAAVASFQSGVKRLLERSGQAPEGVLEALTRSNEQVEAAGQVVQRIRGFLTRHTPQREPVQMPSVVERALNLLRHDLQQRGIAVHWQPTSQAQPVLADPVLLEQVLINLLRNSADALQGQPAPCIEVHIRSSTDHTEVEVSDNGPGLHGQDIDALANPFYTTKADGMGMGLSICRTIIEAHHGALRAEASTSGGARLVFTLPCADANDDVETPRMAEPHLPPPVR